jgi:hypothetical protein
MKEILRPEESISTKIERKNAAEPPWEGMVVLTLASEHETAELEFRPGSAGFLLGEAVVDP